MALIIRKPGILTTVQDLGRTGARSIGINPNGVMDTSASRLVNVLLGNGESRSVLEMHFPAAEILFDSDTWIAIGGADFGATVNDIQIRNWSSSFVKKGSVLKFARNMSGHRAYLAVQGGFHVDDWLGSASTNMAAGIGGLSGRKLSEGDRLDIGGSTGTAANFVIGPSATARYSRFPVVRVVAGSEYDFLTATSEQSFLRERFSLTNDCNRMGFRLQGNPLYLLHELQLVSSAVTFGTIQVLPDGQLIVLMADHQTSGGYPRIATVASIDLPILAQCGPGDQVGFKMISIDEAERLELQFAKELNFLRVGCRLQSQNADD